MNIRQGWHTEKVRDESFRDLISNDKKLKESKLKVLWQLVSGAKTLQEISELIGMKEHLVSARLSDLRKDEWVITDGSKKWNPLTHKNNSLWSLNPAKFEPKQLEIF